MRVGIDDPPDMPPGFEVDDDADYRDRGESHSGTIWDVMSGSQQFESFRDPIIILVSVPLTMT